MSVTPPGSRLKKIGIVLPRGGESDWDNGMVESPAVWYDSILKKYAMVYTGYGRKPDAPDGAFGYDTVTIPQIGLATSADLITWQKVGRGPIVRPSGLPGLPDSHGMAGPVVVPPSQSGFDRYFLFYFGTTDDGYEAGHKTLNVATSKNLTDWETFRGNPIIKPDDTGAETEWRNEAIWHPHIVKTGGVFYLFFNTSGVHNGLHEEFTGYATSDDLLHWTVDDANCPIVVGSAEPGRWDSSGRAGDPSLYRVGDTWYMAFYSWDSVRSQDGLMMTTVDDFPLGWKPYSENPILKFGDPGSFDAQHAGKPFVFRTEDRHFHYYTAVDDAGRREIAAAEGNYL